MELLIEKKPIICALGNLHYQISREKFESEPGFEPRMLKWHPSQEGDLSMSWHENQDSSSGRAQGQKFVGPRFESWFRFEFFS